MKIFLLNCRETPIAWFRKKNKLWQFFFCSCNKSESLEKANEVGGGVETVMLTYNQNSVAKRTVYAVIMGLNIPIITFKVDQSEKVVKYCKTEWSFGSSQRQATLLDSGFKTRQAPIEGQKELEIIKLATPQDKGQKNLLYVLENENQVPKKGAEIDNLYKTVGHVTRWCTLLVFLAQPVENDDPLLIKNNIIRLSIFCTIVNYRQSLIKPKLIPVFVFDGKRWTNVVILEEQVSLAPVSKPVLSGEDQITILTHSDSLSEGSGSEASAMSVEFKKLFG